MFKLSFGRLSLVLKNKSMKKLLLFMLVVLALSSNKAEAQSACPYSYTTVGSTATFSYMWALATIYVVDSVHFDYGDGNNTMYYPPTSSNTHTYTSAGWYNVCLTRYLSQLGTSQAIICTYCDSIFVSGPTAINSVESQGLELWPNPSTGNSVTVQLPHNQFTEFVLYDIFGRKVETRLLASQPYQIQLSVAALAEGIYTLEAIGKNKEKSTIRFQVTH